MPSSAALIKVIKIKMALVLIIMAYWQTELSERIRLVNVKQSYVGLACLFSSPGTPKK